MTSLLLTTLAGFFILIGGVIVFLYKDKNKMHDFSIGLSIGVLSLLLILDLIPETYELISSNYKVLPSIVILVLSSLVGLLLVKLLDIFIPEHDEYSSIHIAVVTGIALFVHNVVEGMALYASLESDIKMGSLLVLGVSMHNFALGLSIASEYITHEKDLKKLVSLLLFLTLSTFIGGLLMMIFNVYLESSVALGIILSLTIGMIVYIVAFELIPHLLKSKNKKRTFIGLIVGALLMILTIFVE